MDWDDRSLLNLLVRRLAANVLICDHYGVTADELLADAELQSNFFYKVFPVQVDRGSSKSKTLDWMISRTADGSKRTAPRELIHLMLSARDEQLKMYQLGNSEPPDDLLFDKASIRAALPTVSTARYEQTLCAEYPTLKPYLQGLEREKSEQSQESLSQLWRMPNEKAGTIAEKHPLPSSQRRARTKASRWTRRSVRRVPACS